MGREIRLNGQREISTNRSLSSRACVLEQGRGRSSVNVPDIPNQPSEAAAHFFFEVAKNVLVKAGGNSSTSLFMQVFCRGAILIFFCRFRGCV